MEGTLLSAVVAQNPAGVVRVVLTNGVTDYSASAEQPSRLIIDLYSNGKLAQTAVLTAKADGDSAARL
jgi:hypothetical protein